MQTQMQMRAWHHVLQHTATHCSTMIWWCGRRRPAKIGHMRHDSCTYDMTLQKRHDLFIRDVTCLNTRTWISHGTCEWVVAHVNESWHTWKPHATRECSSQTSRTRLCKHLMSLCLTSRPIHMWHDAFTRATTDSHAPWLIHICCVAFKCALRDSFTCAMTHSRVPHRIQLKESPSDTSLMPYMTRLYVTWLILMWHDSFTHAPPHSSKR